MILVPLPEEPEIITSEQEELVCNPGGLSAVLLDRMEKLAEKSEHNGMETRTCFQQRPQRVKSPTFNKTCLPGASSCNPNTAFCLLILFP